MKNKILAKIKKNETGVLYKIYSVLKDTKIFKDLSQVYLYDLRRYLKYSRTKVENTELKVISHIILDYHVLEKGLTMPDTRLGFGRERVIALSRLCNSFIDNFGPDNYQLQHAIAVLNEYIAFHEERNYQVDQQLLLEIQNLTVRLGSSIKSRQRNTDSEDYFKFIKSSFDEFSNSRSSVRNFSSEELALDTILKSLDLAKNAPSACNRQSWKTNLYSNKERVQLILEAQGGNRGFGHLANKLIVISGELGAFSNSIERYQVYIDGGMYAMNLLYALHFNKIGACILNCSFTPKKEKVIRDLCNIPESRVLIAMIALGNVPAQFRVASSPRNSITQTNEIVL